MSGVMNAAVLMGHGGPERLQFRRDWPVPTPGPSQVLVEVTAGSVNNTDIWTRRGSYGLPGDPNALAGWRGPVSFPRIQGGDMVGRIVAAGEAVPDARLEKRVVIDPALYDGPPDDASPIGLLGSEADGGFAQYVALNADHAHDVEGSPLSDEELACLPIAYGTAMGMLERGRIHAGETVLVTGASGGVGLALVQLAAARDVAVVALTSADKRAAVEAAGASQTVARTDPNVVSELGRVAPDGFDAVLDVVAGSLLELGLSLLTEGGRWVMAGAVAGSVVTLDVRRLYLHQRHIIGSSMHTRAHFRRFVQEARLGRIRPVIAATYSVDAIHQAQSDFGKGRHVGKFVLRP